MKSTFAILFMLSSEQNDLNTSKDFIRIILKCSSHVLALTETHWLKLYSNLQRLAEYLTQLFGVKTGNPNLASVWIAKTGEKNALKYPRGIRWGSLFRLLLKLRKFLFSSMS